VPSRQERDEPTLAWPSAILHLDMDAFFVNVYLLDHPEARGLPLAVGGRPETRGVVTSASYEARSFGVRSGMATRSALRLCPALKVVPANWERIRQASAQVMEVLRSFGPIEPMSVDEAYVDLCAAPHPHEVAQRVRQAVLDATGLPASAGLATSKVVAKVASEQAKPGGCRVVWPGEEAAFLAPLPVRAILGIGPRTAERLMDLGIETCGQLAEEEPEELARRMGPHASVLAARARGEDGGRSVRAQRRDVKSISAESTFDRDVADREVLLGQVRHLSERVGERLRRKAMLAGRVFVKFRWADFTTFTRQKAVPVPVDADEDIYRVAAAIWLENWPRGQRVRLLGVGVGDLQSSAARQLRLDLA
jgi:DNA polymerase-4